MMTQYSTNNDIEQSLRQHTNIRTGENTSSVANYSHRSGRRNNSALGNYQT